MCRSNHWDLRDSWARGEIEDRPRTDVRISDTDRQATIDELARHTGEGRLTLDEFEARVDETWHAVTRSDLRRVMRELPVERPPQVRRRHSTYRRRSIALWLAVIVGAVVLIGPGSLWWLLPLAWFRFGAFRGHRHHRYNETREWSRRRDELTHA